MVLPQPDGLIGVQESLGLSFGVSLSHRKFCIRARDTRTTKLRKRELARGDRGKCRANSSLRENFRC